MAAEVMILSKGGITYRDILEMQPQEIAEWQIRLVEAQGMQYFDFERMRFVEIKRGQ